jgi:TadE-like protein
VTRQAGQSSVEFGASAIVLFLLLFGLIDLGRVYYFDVGLTGATREAARQASWFVLPQTGGGNNPSLYDTDGWAQDPCPYEAGGNPNGDPNQYPGIKQAVDCNLNKYHLPSSVLMNSTATCPDPTDGNASHNPPYTDATYPADVNQPLLYICYANTPGLDLTSAPADNSYKGEDVNVILVMSYGFAGGFMPGIFGSSIHIVANTHMVIGGY